MAEDSTVKTERNRVDKQKNLTKKQREDVQIKKLIATPCQAILKLLLKNICYQKVPVPNIASQLARYLHSDILPVDDHDNEVATDLPSTKRLVSTNEQTKVIQEVVSPEVSKLNHTVAQWKKSKEIKCSFL